MLLSSVFLASLKFEIIYFSEVIASRFRLGLIFLFKFAHKFTSLNFHNITIKLWKQKKIIIIIKNKKQKKTHTIILEQYLQYLYKNKVFTNFRQLWVSKKSTGRSYRWDPLNILRRKCFLERKREGFFFISFTNKKD